MSLVEERLLPSAEPVRLIDQDGVPHANPSYPLPTKDALVDGYVQLIKGRRINDQASALVRQGRLAVYPSSHGQEACQVAATMVLREGDWLFPTYRDTVSIVSRGVDPIETLTLLRGDWHSGYDPYARNVAPQSTPLATQLTHAVGVAHAARLKGEDTVVMALCGDGGTSEGDFHEALNFAAVFHAPVVFFIQNNEYAISVPLAKQSVAPSLAHKGIGYGVPGERADGNDLAGLLAVLGQAVEKARAGKARSSWRHTPTVCRRIRTPTTRPATARTPRSRRGWTAIRSSGSRLTSWRKGCSTMRSASGRRVRRLRSRTSFATG